MVFVALVSMSMSFMFSMLAMFSMSSMFMSLAMVSLVLLAVVGLVPLVPVLRVLAVLDGRIHRRVQLRMLTFRNFVRCCGGHRLVIYDGLAIALYVMRHCRIVLRWRAGTQGW
jgi:hypothetical protein